MTRIIGFIVLIVALLIGYNYFFGDAAEKEKASNIVNEVKELGGEVKGLFKDQKEKYERGDYDKVLDKIGSFVENLKAKSGDLNTNESNDLDSIEKEIDKLRDKLDQVDEDDLPKIENIKKDIESLINKANDLVKELESK